MLQSLRWYGLRLLLALVIFLITGEILVRALDVVDRLNGYQRSLYTRGPSRELAYLLRPGLETTQFGIPVRVNRFGLRGPEIAPAPAPGVRRVLMLGDSLMFGTGLAEAETLSSAVQARLNADGPPLYEVLNAGVPGYNTGSEVRLFERLGGALTPWAAVLAVSLNDFRDAPQLSPVGFLTYRPEPPRLADHSEFLVLLRWALEYRQGKLWHQFMQRAEDASARRDPERVARSSAAVDRWVQKQHLEFYSAPDPARLSAIRTALAELRALAAARGIRLLVAIFPEGFQVGVSNPDLTPQRVWQDACRATGVTCVDLHAAFAAEGGDLFQDTQHPNARGHVVASAIIAEALAGETAQIRDAGDARPDS
jgi:lysophospholipase L1-like esterase